MNLLDHLVREPARVFPPSDVWAVGRTTDDDSIPGPRRPRYSYLSECECPDDCLRDHENE